MPDFDKIESRTIIVGGVPVGFTKSTGTVQIAGDDYSMEEWQAIEHRINMFFTRAGLMKNPRFDKSRDSNSGTSSFLTVNIKEILSRRIGKIKPAPFWLKGLYSGVITKEELWEQ